MKQEQDNQAVGKPRTNVYTMMLVLSLIFLITASVLLYWELGSYNNGEFMQWWNVNI